MPFIDDRAAHRSHMESEIGEIPGVIARLVDASDDLLPAVRRLKALKPNLVSIVARGSSAHAGLYAKYLIETSIGVPVTIVSPSIVTAYERNVLGEGTALVAISQSGYGSDILEVTAAARSAGAMTLAVTNDTMSPLAEACHFVLDCGAGEELSVPATKTYVAQLGVIAALVSRWGDDRDLGAAMAQLPAQLTGIVDRSRRDLTADHPLAVAVDGATSVTVISRGYNLATVNEIALKLKEAAGVFADPYSAAEFLHGPIALTGKGTALIAVAPDGPASGSIQASVAAAAEAGAGTWILGPAKGGCSFELPRMLEKVTPLAYVIPGQFLALAVAARRGLDPDRPPSLSKVTVTR